VTDFLFRWWWLVLVLGVPAVMVFVCHAARLGVEWRIWWWRR
jgi:hypothetical protein